MASSSSGTCWYSSIRTGCSDSTNLAGSSRTAALVAKSSQSSTARPRCPANSLSRVLLPTVRGPLRTTTGSSVSLASTTSPSRRLARPVSTPCMFLVYRCCSAILLSIFRVSRQNFPYLRGIITLFPPAGCQLAALGTAEADRTWSAPPVLAAGGLGLARISGEPVAVKGSAEDVGWAAYLSVGMSVRAGSCRFRGSPLPVLLTPWRSVIRLGRSAWGLQEVINPRLRRGGHGLRRNHLDFPCRQGSAVSSLAKAEGACSRGIGGRDPGKLGSIRWPVAARQAGRDLLGVVTADRGDVIAGVAACVIDEHRGVLPVQLPGHHLPGVGEPVVAAGALADHGKRFLVPG